MSEKAEYPPEPPTRFRQTTGECEVWLQDLLESGKQNPGAENRSARPVGR